MPRPTRGHERGTPVVDGVVRVDPDDAGYTAVSPTPMSGVDAMPSQTRTIVVTGDVSIDWLLLSSADEGRGAVDFIWMWGGAYTCRALSSSGGAASHAEILRAAVAEAGLRDVPVVGPEVPAEALASPLHPAYTHTFARIQRFDGIAGAAATHAPGASPSSWAPIPRGRRRPPQASRCRKRRHADDRRPRHGLPASPCRSELLAAARAPSSGRPARRSPARRSPTRCSTSTPTSSPSSPRPTSCARRATRSATRSPGSSSPRRSSPPSAPTRSRARGA